MENPVINACTNLTHPCQALADMLTIQEKKGDFKGLKLAYAGDIWNVCQSLMVAGPMLGMDVYVAGPKGYGPDERILKFATAKAKETGTKLVITHDLDEAVTDADVIYANTWHSMGAKDVDKRLKDFGPYQINEQVLAKAKDDVIFMHCGPAFHGEEMTDEVIYGSHSAVWDEAENRMHTEKAVLSLVVG
jgi:ornithine carbamoyltransferase